jgi:hypothetical protein
VDALDTEQRIRAHAPAASRTRHRVIHVRVSFRFWLLGRYQFKEALTSLLPHHAAPRRTAEYLRDGAILRLRIHAYLRRPHLAHPYQLGRQRQNPCRRQPSRRRDPRPTARAWPDSRTRGPRLRARELNVRNPAAYRRTAGCGGQRRHVHRAAAQVLGQRARPDLCHRCAWTDPK